MKPFEYLLLPWIYLQGNIGSQLLLCCFLEEQFILGVISIEVYNHIENNVTDATFYIVIKSITNKSTYRP